MRGEGIGLVAIVLVALVCAGDPAKADGCARSRDFIFANAAGELPQKSSTYRAAFRMCREALGMSNVKDAFVLKSGAVAVIPRSPGITATAATLAEFCMRFRHGLLRFVRPEEVGRIVSLARIVELSTANTTPCAKIAGGG